MINSSVISFVLIIVYNFKWKISFLCFKIYEFNRNLFKRYQRDHYGVTMLTYSFALDKPTTISPLKKIASAHIVNSLWHANFRLGESASLFAEGWEILLNRHRKETLNASHNFIEEKNLPRIFDTILKESICSLYKSYSEMVLWKKNYFPYDEIELMDKNKLYAPNYFTVDGEFNDIAWSKRFVLDPSYPLITRFYLACYYWFPSESAVLWSQLKKSDSVPCNGDLSSIQNDMDPIVTLRIFQLEDQLEILSQNPGYAGNFYKVGFQKAVIWGCEYAAYYFWQNLDEQEKINITGTDSYPDMVKIYGIGYTGDRINYFLYSQLSKEQKKFILDRIIKFHSRYNLASVLTSPYIKEVSSELIELVYQLPIDLYSKILYDIARDLTEEDRIIFPLHCKVFEVLWNNFYPQGKESVLNDPTSFVRELIESKSSYNLNI